MAVPEVEGPSKSATAFQAVARSGRVRKMSFPAWHCQHLVILRPMKWAVASLPVDRLENLPAAPVRLLMGSWVTAEAESAVHQAEDQQLLDLSGEDRWPVHRGGFSFGIFVFSGHDSFGSFETAHDWCKSR